MNTKHLAFGLRFVYIVLILIVLLSSWRAALFNLIIFVVTLPILFVAKKDKRYYTADIFLMILFVLTLGLRLVGLELVSSVFGLDKLFHFTAGMAMAVLFSVILEKYISNKWIYYVVIILSSLALGAGWEMFEWLFIVIFSQPIPDVLYYDTIIDLIVDTLGAIMVVVWIAVRKGLK